MQSSLYPHSNPTESNNSLSLKDRIDQILKGTRADLSPLSLAGFRDLPEAKRRLVILLEQIAHIHQATSQRGMSTLLGVSQGTITNYLKGIMVDPLAMKPHVFKELARRRGISEELLRDILTLKDLEPGADRVVVSSDLTDLDISVEKLIQIIDELPLNDLLSGLKRITHRLELELAEEGSNADKKKPGFDPIPKPQPHEGNLRLLELVVKRQQTLGMTDEEFLAFGATFCEKGEEEFSSILDYLEFGLEPIDNRYLTGVLRRVTGVSSEELFETRDGKEYYQEG